MSGKIAGMVWDLDLPHGEKYVLLAMADHAEHDGTNIHPSVGLIAWKTDYSERQVMRLIQALRDKRLLILEEDNSASGLRSNLYRIDFTHAPFKPNFRGRDQGKKKLQPKRTPDKMSPVGPQQGVTKRAKKPDKMSGRGDSIVSGGDDSIVSPDPSLTVINRPTHEPSPHGARAGASGEREPDLGSAGLDLATDPATVQFLKAHRVRAWAKFQTLPFRHVDEATRDVRHSPALIAYRCQELLDRRAATATQLPNDAAPLRGEPTPGPFAERWHGARAALETTIPAHDFVTWIEPTALLELTDTTAIIATPNCFVRDRVQAQYAGVLASALGVDAIEVVISQEVGQ